MIERRSLSSRIFDIMNPIVLILFAFMCIYPFYYMIIYSLSDSNEAAKGIFFLPVEFTLKNYIQVMKLETIPRAFLISIARTAVGSCITLICCSFFAFIVTKPEMYLRRLVYRLFIITMYVGGGMIPTYLVYRAYGLRNTFWVYILPSALSAFNVVLIKTYMESIPESLEESAVLDGAGIFTCWWKIAMPLSKPILATVMLFSVVAQWNSWFDAHIYMTRTDMHPLQYILYKYLNEAQALANRMRRDVGTDANIKKLTPASVRMTVTAINMIPIMLVYPYLQRHFVKGLMMGAVKG